MVLKIPIKKMSYLSIWTNGDRHSHDGEVCPGVAFGIHVNWNRGGYRWDYETMGYGDPTHWSCGFRVHFDFFLWEFFIGLNYNRRFVPEKED